MKPKLSIIIPCYNIEPHISKCVESILEQTFNDFELLLINDGSKDNTLEICREYEQKDTRVKVYSHDNKGVSYTRNRGIELAQGECILFIDGDDYVKPDYLEKLVANYADGIWPICGMINVKKGEVKENENFKKLLTLFPDKVVNKENIFEVLAHHSLSSPCARVYSKTILAEKKILFPEDVTYQEDLLFNLEYCKHIEQVRLLNYFGYYYIEHQVSSTGRYHKNFNHIEDLFLSLSSLVKTKRDKEIVQEFIFQTILRKITNIFHPDCPKSRNKKLKELKDILQSESYSFMYSFISKSEINIILKLMLRLKSPFLLFNYYRLLH